MVTAEQHQAALNRQKQAQADNAKQKQYVADLRAGKINIATALLNPQTTKSYTVKGQSVDVSGTSINLPQFIAVSGYDVAQPEVIPNSLFFPQSINVSGSSAREIAKEREIQLKAGISSDLNLTSATSMNDWISTNPTRQINMGIQKPSTCLGVKCDMMDTRGLHKNMSTSIPKNNQVQTRNLGGNNQRQETDSDTNVEKQSTLDYTDYTPSLVGSTGIVLAGLAALLLLGKRK